MQTIQKILSISLPYQFLPDKSIHDSDLLLFDIETTGFSPDITSIYLIGCCYYQNNSWNLLQFFADDYISEEIILKAFISLAKNFRIMVHFNGSGFDIPYIQKKLAHYNIDFSFDSFLHLDLYKKVFPYKKILNLPNLKQKTVEDFLGLPREDAYSGGELIEVYVNYMKDKFGHKTEMEEEFQKLLLHNEEDVTNLIRLTSILAYCDIFEEQPALTDVTQNNNEIVFSLKLRNPIQQTVSFQTPDLHFRAVYNTAELVIPAITGTFKYFYPNYKDYYYLPQEDTAIHKSVAEFVDKEYRVKAKAATCYTKKSGTFLPQFYGTLEPSFRNGHKDKESYLELTDTFLSNQEKCTQYVIGVLQYIRDKASKSK